MKPLSLCLLSVLAVLGAAQPTVAQQKPAIIIAHASVDKLLSDAAYLAKAADAEQVIALAQFMAQQYVQLLDTKQPAGVIIDFVDGQPSGIAFVPVNDYPRMKEMLTAQVAKPQDMGNGIDKMDLGQPVFMKSSGNFVFVSSTIDRLQQLPANPVALLEGLDRRYLVGVQCNVQSIPVELRRVAITEMKQTFEREAADKFDEDFEGELAEKSGRNMLKQLTAVIEESETATIGWGVDQTQGNTFIEASLTAKRGTKMAQKMNLLSRISTSFSGLNLPEAAAYLNYSTILGPDQVKHNLDVIGSLEQALMKEIEDESDSTKEKAQKLIQSSFKVLKDTVATGRTDGAGVVLLQDADPKLQVAAAQFVADGSELDRVFREAVELAAQEGKTPNVDFNASSHKGVNFHTASIGDLDEDAKKVFGDKVTVAVGIGPKAIYIAAGGDPVALLRKVIDKSSQSQATTPATAKISLTPIIRFARSVDDAPAAAAILDALSQAAGRDHISLTSKVIPNGVQYRVLVEDGVIRAVAKAAQTKR